MILNMFLITLIIVFVIDLSGIIQSAEEGLSKWLKGKAIIPKPFSCSLCMSWWTNLIYILCIHQFTIVNVSIIALFAFLTPVFSTFMLLVKEVLGWVIEKGFECLK